MPGKLDYRSPGLVELEMRHLISRGARAVSIAASNFTGHPDRASAIVAILPELRDGYNFSSRVDSLYHAIQHHPEAWQRFAELGGEIELGVESFLPERLMRLGKYRTLEQARRQADRLEHIIDFFSGSRTSMFLNLVNFDWKMTIEESEADANALRNLLRKYAGKVRITTEWLSNMVFESPGSRFAREMQPLDFYRYQDPRLLMLVMMLKVKTGWRGFEPAGDRTSELAEVCLTLEFYLACLKMVRQISPGYLSLEPALAQIQKGGGAKDVLDAFYAQFNPEEQQRLRSFF